MSQLPHVAAHSRAVSVASCDFAAGRVRRSSPAGIAVGRALVLRRNRRARYSRKTECRNIKKNTREKRIRFAKQGAGKLRRRASHSILSAKRARITLTRRSRPAAAYRNEVRTTFDALKANRSDAERKPEGFKELEIHLRRTLWQIDRTLPAVPIEHRELCRKSHDDLGRIHTELNSHAFSARSSAKKSGDK